MTPVSNNSNIVGNQNVATPLQNVAPVVPTVNTGITPSVNIVNTNSDVEKTQIFDVFESN